MILPKQHSDLFLKIIPRFTSEDNNNTNTNTTRLEKRHAFTVIESNRYNPLRVLFLSYDSQLTMQI